MRKRIHISEIRTNTGTPLHLGPYVIFADEFLAGARPEDSSYLKHLKDLLKKHGRVWDYIKTEKDCLARARVFRDLCYSIKKDGYQDIYKIHFNPKTKLAYGYLTVQNKGTYYKLIDGHHRASILIALGHEYLTVDEFVYSYQDMFPPAQKLKNMVFNFEGKLVVEIGCNIGMFGEYVLNRGAKDYTGFDHKEEYIAEGKSRNPKANIHVMKGQEVHSNSDVFCALGVFHHMEGDSIANVLKNNTSEYLIFENPVGNKPLEPYKVRPKQWYFDLIQPMSVEEYEYGFNYPIERKIFVCKR